MTVSISGEPRDLPIDRFQLALQPAAKRPCSVASRVQPPSMDLSDQGRTNSNGLQPTSDALVTSSFLFLLVRHLLLVAMHLLLLALASNLIAMLMDLTEGDPVRTVGL